MSVILENMKNFVKYAGTLAGSEKGEAQVFCDRLFKAFGHDGYKEAGAILEFKIKKKTGKGVSFADLVWKPHVLIEMKKSGENLNFHYQQAFDYWINAVPDRPRYMVLCNFQEFWIYDFNKQMYDPVDIVRLHELPERYIALNFLFPDNPPPLFGNDREEVSRTAAAKVAALFRSLIDRGIDRGQAQQFVLQTVVAMFAEDIDLMPNGTIIRLVNDCLNNGQNSYDIFGGLFRQMNSKESAPAGRYVGIPYFNGGLFSKIKPIELNKKELLLLGQDNEGAAWQNWRHVNPVIFGTIFQQSMDQGARHAYGAHFTNEADIHRVVGPTIVQPWRERIDSARTMKELLALRQDLLKFRVLDPACGSGNFLYISYREMVKLEILIVTRLDKEFSQKNILRNSLASSLISPRQFYGMDRDSFAVELAKVTLMLAKKLALEEAVEMLGREQIDLPLSAGDGLPLDNLDSNFTHGDALFVDWPEVDTIVGNPPYQSKNKMQGEYGPAYLTRLRAAYPDVLGRADYCVYWFRKAHDHLKPKQRAGLVGTNTIRQNYSRISGLDYIVDHDGTITQAVSTMPWSGDAVVHVSIVNWIKGKQAGKKRIFNKIGNNPIDGWSFWDVDRINSSLSTGADVSQAKKIEENARNGGCFQGQTHGHKGFLLSPEEASIKIDSNKKNSEILFPFLIADDFLGTVDGQPSRWVIDFQQRELPEAKSFTDLFQRVENLVLPDRKKAAAKEALQNQEVLNTNPKARVNRHHANFLKRWWQLSWQRDDMMTALGKLSRYIVCSRITARPIFEFVSTKIHPNDALSVFALEDDYSFGILQSTIHWEWFQARCSTMKADPRYTSDTVFDSFPWPQKPTVHAIRKVSEAAIGVRAMRATLKRKYNQSLREMYRDGEGPGEHPLKKAQATLDAAVRDAYEMPTKSEVLVFLLNLNEKISLTENSGQRIVGPGLPPETKFPEKYITKDCLILSC